MKKIISCTSWYQKLIEQSKVYYSLEIQESTSEAEEEIIDTKPVVVEDIPQEIAQQQKEQEEHETEPNVVMESPIDKIQDEPEGGRLSYCNCSIWQ